MANIFEMSVDKKGTTRYRKDKKFTAKENVPDVTLEHLTAENIVDENGLVIVENKGVDDSAETEADNATPEADATPAIDESDLIDNGSTPDDEDTTTPADVPVAEAPVPKEETAKPVRKRSRVRPYVSSVPQSKPGMGFPRANGKTGDIFDVNVPHDNVRQMGTLLVPVSAKNYAEKSDDEIRQRLEELGYDVYDVNRFGKGGETAGVLDDEGDDLTDDEV